IDGEDDPATLKHLYDQIADVDWKVYAGLDDKTLGMLDTVKLDTVKLDALSEANLDYGSVTVLFLPSELGRAQAAFDDAKKLGLSKEVWLVPLSLYDPVLDALAAAGERLNVKNTASQFLALLDLWERHGDEIGREVATDATEGVA
nr:hypothetical protein [Actinomycetota bacterium]